MKNTKVPASPAEFRVSARKRLPRFLFDYVDGAANGETTLAMNQQDLGALLLRQRVLRDDMSEVRLSTRLFGRDLAAPIVLGPIGLAGMYARRGEVQAKRAADAAGLPFCLSTVSVCPMAEVARAGTTPLWFQLYVMRDRGFMRELIDEAVRVRAGALVLTVDMPVPGSRYRDLHSGMSGSHAGWQRAWQAMTHPRWSWDVGLQGRPHTLGNIAPALGGRTGLQDFIGWMGANFDPSIQWKDLAEIRSRWPGPLILKGILDVEDAVQAADLGVDGIVVSNHGGRQLDGVSSSARVLPSIADAVAHRLVLMADSGVRSGLDVVRMLALGAQAVWIGRLWAYALAAGGEEAIGRLLDALMKEMRVAMTLTGCRDIKSLDRKILA